MFDRLRIPKASGVVIDRIKEEIVEGRVKPGMRLPSERDLATQMVVSRPVVREALRMLQFMGVVEMKPGTSGALVLDGNMAMLSDSLTLFLDLKCLSQKEVMIVRQALEPLAAALAAAQRGESHLKEMAEIIEGMQSGRCEGAEFSAANARFHIVMAEASGNVLLYTMMKAFSRLIYRNLETFARTEGVRQIVLRGLSAIYGAIVDGDPPVARAEMEDLLAEALLTIEGKRVFTAEDVTTNDLQLIQ